MKELVKQEYQLVGYSFAVKLNPLNIERIRLPLVYYKSGEDISL